MVSQAGPGSIAGIRVRAVIIQGIAAGRSRRPIRMGTHPGGTDVVRTVVTVIRAGCTVNQVGVRTQSAPVANVVGTFVTVVRARRTGGHVIDQAGPGSVARVRIRTVVDQRTTAGRT